MELVLGAWRESRKRRGSDEGMMVGTGRSVACSSSAVSGGYPAFGSPDTSELE